MSGTNELERQFEDFVVGQMNSGALLANIQVSELHAAVEGSKYTECAEWLDAYKARFGAFVVAEQPEWFKAFLGSLSTAAESMWPRVFEQMQVEVAKVQHQEQEEKQQLQSQLTDALSTVGKHEQQIEILEGQLTDSQAQIQSKDKALEVAQAKIIELASAGGSGVSEEALDAIKQTHEQAMTKVTTAHGQTVELLNSKATELESSLTESKAETERLSGEMEALRTERDTATKSAEELQTRLTGARDQLKELEAQVQKLKDSQSPDAKKLEKLSKKVEEQKSEIKALNKRIEGHENRNEMLVQQNAQQAEQLQKSTDRLFAASEAQFKAEAESEILRGQLGALSFYGASEGSETAPHSESEAGDGKEGSKSK
ncbi:hypothetical protein P3447_09310 [Vibrio parahaemolyticus]|nr:hypothetical protein [Vibrio parahaemolyticus]